MLHNVRRYSYRWVANIDDPADHGVVMNKKDERRFREFKRRIKRVSKLTTQLQAHDQQSKAGQRIQQSLARLGAKVAAEQDYFFPPVHDGQPHAGVRARVRHFSRAAGWDGEDAYDVVHCPKCHKFAHRDFNAARNILLKARNAVRRANRALQEQAQDPVA